LNLSADRFQVICATASFSEAGKTRAGDFGAALSGADPSTFDPAAGDLKLRTDPAVGTTADVAALAGINLTDFYDEDPQRQASSVASFLAYREVDDGADLGPALHAALKDYGPFAVVVNATMSAALSLDEVRGAVFPHADAESGAAATNALLALGSRARLKPEDASLLPCRVHAFFRGLPGLWACMDPNCSKLLPEESGGPIGRLYSQPRERCGCGAAVLEYFTCRYCGASYARAYAKDLANPEHIFAEPGEHLVTEEGIAESFHKLDLLLEPPASAVQGVPALYDLDTGRLNPAFASDRLRTVYLPPSAGVLSADDDENDDPGHDGPAGPGQFVPCGCCARRAGGGRSSVQDHLTKGDQPFQALLASQIKVQPPGPKAATEFAPLRGRKVLVFSDSRQVAARLAPTLQTYSLRDAIRALLPAGYRMMQTDPALGNVVLDQAWIAAVVAAHRFGVRLRPELEASEVMPRLKDTPAGAIPTTADILELRNEKPPVNLTRAISETLRDNILAWNPWRSRQSWKRQSSPRR
jgi:hypothetical protein